MGEEYPTDPKAMTDDQAIKLFTHAFPNAFTDPNGPEEGTERQMWGQSIRDCLCAETPDKAVEILRNNKFTEPVTVAFNLLEQARDHQIKPGWIEP